MHKILISLILVLFAIQANCQPIKYKKVRKTYTIIATDSAGLVTKKVSSYLNSHIGAKVALGVSSLKYFNGTDEWLGFSCSPFVNYALTYGKWNAGFSITPWSSYPKKVLQFEEKSLWTDIEMGFCKSNYYGGYTFDLGKGFTIEPFAGYSLATFSIINSILYFRAPGLKDASGPLVGISFNKYFYFDHFRFLNVFANVNYADIDYTKINGELERGCLEMTLGVGFRIIQPK